MKKMRYCLTVLLCGLFAVSCSLDENVYTSVYKEAYMNNVEEAETVLLGVYRCMTVEGMYRYNLSLLLQIPTDMEKGEGTTTDNFRLQCANAYNASDSNVEVTWSALYNGVYLANDFIEALESRMGSYDEDEKEEAEIQLAEARCLRALYYFELVRWFGHITLVKDPAEAYTPSYEFEQNDPVEVYEFIEEDLLAAIDVLPYASDDVVRSSNSFRFSKGAALGLLTKVYCTWAGYPIRDVSKWEDAVNTAKTLIDSDKHKLNEGTNGDGFKQLWYNTCNSIWEPGESLIEVSFYAPAYTGSSDPVGRIGKWNGVVADGILGIQNFGMYKITPSFLCKWKSYESDKRFDLSYADFKYTPEKTYYNTTSTFLETMEDDSPGAQSSSARRMYVNNMTPKKWDTEEYVEEANYLVYKDYSNINWYILRYADVLLLYAEALNELNNGPTAEAYNAVNMVRRRGFGLPVNSTSAVADLEQGMSYSEFQQAIMDERGYELAFEGHRRQDLIRWGIYYESVMQTADEMDEYYVDGHLYYLGSQYTQKGKNELLPIPQRDIDLMPKYEQNPGW